MLEFRCRITSSIVLMLALLTAATAVAEPGPGARCQAQKNKAAGAYAACRTHAESSLALTGDVTKYADALGACAARFTRKWQRLEAKAAAAGTPCPGVGHEARIEAAVAATTDTVAALASGVRFRDNFDGTVTDFVTGLQWEKKTDDGSVHDKNDTYYVWSEVGSVEPIGSAFTKFLPALNDCARNAGNVYIGGFAGHCDWRLPTVAELETLLLAHLVCPTNPCIDPIFGPTEPARHLTTTALGADPLQVWVVDFQNAVVTVQLKEDTGFVRAVRGGS